MSDNKAQIDRIVRYNDLIARQMGKAVRPYRTDGFVNLLTRYGTQKDPTEQFKYAPEPTIPDDSLTMFYEGNGLFAKIIDAPAEEAIKHGFTLRDVKDQEIEDFYQEALDELDWEETAMTAIKWARLFGGSIAVMLINDGGGLEEPLNWKKIKSIDDIRVYDRSVIQPDYQSMFSYDPKNPFSTRGSRLGMPEYYRVSSRYGAFTVHESRCLVFQNGILPENSSNSIYQLWGMPEYVRIHRALRDAEIAHGSAPKMLDRSVQAVYKMKDLSAELATEEGENRVLKRLQTIDMARGMLNSITVDSEGEDYDFRSFQFSGVSDVIDSACNYLSALTNIPQSVLFGRSPTGMSDTGKADLENWYSYVDRIRKRMLRSNLRYLLSVIFQAGVATGEVDEVPKIKIDFNPLWSLSKLEQADLDQKKVATQLSKAQTAQIYVDMQAIDPTEVRRKLAESNEFDVENMLDEIEDDEDLLAALENGMTDTFGQLPQSGNFSRYAEGVDLSEHTAMPEEKETSGNAPDAAPAATKLPQDMTTQEAAEVEENTDSGEPTSNTTEDAKPFSVGVLVISEGKVLSGTRHNDFGYGLVCGPGGHGEKGETPEQAAFRETEEEFGISPKHLIPLGRGPVEPDTGLQPYLFLCTEYDGEPNCVDLEMTGAKFRTLEELDELAASMFQPFADGLEILKTCIDTALFFGDDGGEMHDELTECIGKAVAEDGGPGSGNHGHAGVPGQVGGSAPSDAPRLSNRDKPNVMGGGDFDGYVKKNNLKTIYRGYSAPTKEQENERASAVKNASVPESDEKSSALGKGVYYSNSESEAADYLARRKGETGDKFGRVSTAALDVGAKVGDYDELKRKHLENQSSMTKNAFKVMKEKGADSKEFQDAIAECESNNSFDNYVRNQGYDAFEHPATGYTVVVNQNALVVRDDGLTNPIISENPIDKSAQSGTITSKEISEDGGPGSGRYPKGSGEKGEGKSEMRSSAKGANKFAKGFSTANLKAHFGSGGEHDHIKQYPGVTREQYAQMALDLVQKEVGGSVKGYKNKLGQVVRYDSATGDFVKGHPDKGIATMFKPDNGDDYFDRWNKKEGIEDE